MDMNIFQSTINNEANLAEDCMNVSSLKKKSRNDDRLGAQREDKVVTFLCCLCPFVSPRWREAGSLLVC